MMFRRKRTDEAAEPTPAWQQRFDAAVDMIRSRPQPAWLESRLDELQTALVATDASRQRLAQALEQVDPERTARDLKSALRDRRHLRPDADARRADRRVDTARQRYDAVNEMANRRDLIAQQLDETIDHVELLAVQAVHRATMGTSETPDHDLDEHLERLDTDLRALELARREVDAI